MGGIIDVPVKKKFAIVHDLYRLSEAERIQYLRDVSEFLGVDPDLNAFNIIPMTDPLTGLGKLTVYAHRGTTDLLRDLRGINVLSMEQHDGPDYVSFTATGINREKRQEIAVGAHELIGPDGKRFTGKKLADAIATAQTRTGQRLTLIFVGLGILGESEVHPEVLAKVAQNAGNAQLSGSGIVAPPPTVIPPAAPGKILEAKTEFHVQIPAHSGLNAVVAPPPGVPASAIEVAKKADVELTIHDLTPSESASIIAAATGIVSGTIAAQSTQDSPQEKPKRTRRKRNTVQIDSPGQQLEIPAGYINQEGKIVPDPAGQEAFRAEQQKLADEASAFLTALTKKESEQVSTPTVPVQQTVSTVPVVESLPPVVSAQPVGAPIDPAKDAEYRAKLQSYPLQMLMPTTGIGGVTMKLREFARRVTGATDARRLTDDQWSVLFEEMDNVLNQSGPAGLVAHIDKTLGV